MPNIFDSKLGSPTKQLLRLHLLHRLTRSAGASESDGCAVESIKADLYQLGVGDADVSLLLKQLLEFRTFRTADGRAMNEKSVLLPTRFGAYLLRDLGTTFQYVEMTSLDSVIMEEAHWELLRDLTIQIESSSREKQLEIRLQRARRFMEYLQGIEEKWAVQSKRYNVGGGWDEQVVKNHLMLPLEEDLKRVEESAAKRLERIRAAAGGS